MNLPVPEELISAYFDGEVTPEERSQVEHWLETSPEFRQQLDDTSKLSALLHSFPREVAPPELASHVQKHVLNAVIESPPKVSAPSRSFRREWTAFGVGILATMASLLMFVRLNPQPRMVRYGMETVSLGEKTSLIRSKSLAETAPTEVNLADSDAVQLRSYQDEPSKQENWNVVDSPEAKELSSAKDAAPVKLSMASNSNDFNFNAFQNQVQEDFLLNLNNGDVIVPKVADPDNTVAVVGFIVVDMIRDSSDLKLVLQKRAVTELDHTEGLNRRNMEQNNKRDSASKENSDKATGNDDLQVFFVRAPGDQLAGAIDEFRKNHPDLNWVPQMPIELPSTSVANQKNGVENQSSVQAGLNGKLNESQDDSKAVSAEAELAFGVYLARNSSLGFSPDADNDAKTTAAADNEVTQKSKQPPAPRLKKEDLKVSGVQTTPSLSNENSNDNNAGFRTGGQAYFRVTAQNQQAFVAQNSIANNSITNSATPLSNGYGGGLFGQNKSLNFVSKGENRNSRPVKMLIVLKAEQPPAQPSH